MKLLLVHPPLDDPTLPYHSLAYLKGNLVANGFHDAVVRDINIEYVCYTFEPGPFAEFNAECDRRIQDLAARPRLNYLEQEEYQALVSSNRTTIEELQRAAQGFRVRESVLDYRLYLKNLNCLTGYLGLLGALSYPAENLGFTQRTRGRFSYFNLKDLFDSDLAARVCWPFEKYFMDRLAQDEDFINADVLGISAVYDHQLCHAVHLARIVKRVWPGKKVIFGGTSISQIYKHLKDKASIRRFFEICDAIVVGEGETAICEIAASEGRFDGSQKFANTILYDRAKDEVLFPEIHYESVPKLGSPIYEHPWNLYLSPARGINYAPTRGCYWNRCTFCDYGLNSDKPTSPWRERKIEQCVADLKDAQDKFGVKYVYFAVDVMAPGYLERLSDAIMESGLDIRWSAELRMEKIFSLERCQKMARAGCVCVSFGMESGNQRILDLIDKGTSVKYMAETMKNFAAAGIACQLMAFTDFPTETAEERQETLRFVSDNAAHWSTGGMGTFLLTGASIIAKNPARFGITTVERQDCDVARAVSYRVDSETGQKSALVEDADASFDESGGIFPPVLGRPWAGGTDTLHSMIYYEHYGRQFFRENQIDPPATEMESSGDVDSLEIVINGQLAEASYDLNAMIANHHAFVKYLKDRLDVPAEPTFAAFCAWAAQLGEMARTEKPQYWLLSGKQCLKLDKLTYRVLSAAARNIITVQQVLDVIPESLRAKFYDYLVVLEEKGLICFARNGKINMKLVRANESVIVRPDGKDAVYGKLEPTSVA